ncbi:MAG: hypothetical protein V1494_06745 [Candidatus Diapherotrites archaeon]
MKAGLLLALFVFLLIVSSAQAFWLNGTPGSLTEIIAVEASSNPQVVHKFVVENTGYNFLGPQNAELNIKVKESVARIGEPFAQPVTLDCSGWPGVEFTATPQDRGVEDCERNQPGSNVNIFGFWVTNFASKGVEFSVRFYDESTRKWKPDETGGYGGFFKRNNYASAQQDFTGGKIVDANPNNGVLLRAMTAAEQQVAAINDQIRDISYAQTAALIQQATSSAALEKPSVYTLTISDLSKVSDISVKVLKFNESKNAFEEDPSITAEQSSANQEDYLLQFPAGNGVKYTLKLNYTDKTDRAQKIFNVPYDLVVEASGTIYEVAK